MHPSRHAQFRSRLVMLLLRHAHFRLGLVMLLSWHTHFRPGLVMLLLWHSHSRPGSVMLPVTACPFSAKIGYAPVMACLFSAKIGYAPVVEGSSSVHSVLSQREKDRRTSEIMHRVAKSHTAGILQHGAVHYQRLCPRSQMRRSSPMSIERHW